MISADVWSLFWKGFSPASHGFLDEQTLLIRLTHDEEHTPMCSRCNRPCLVVHDINWRRVRESPIMQYRVELDVPVRRLRCQHCGPARERIDWLPGRSRITQSLRKWIEKLVQMLPVSHVASLLGLHWHTVKTIDMERLKRDLNEPDRSQLRRLMMDEFALHKGHRYATVVACADTQQVLWIGEGRSREAIRPFFEWLGDARNQIEAVAMDMNSAFDLEVKSQCPNAVVVYDRFHVVAKYGREVIDRVRVDQANQLRDDKIARKVIKSSRWMLLRNADNLEPEQAVKLDELLAANASLTAVYVLKDQLKTLWFAKDETTARSAWQEWTDMALGSGIEALARFARNLGPYREGIVSSARYRLNTSVLEGMNNRIKVIKRMAYGYRDTAYFFLKIRAAFPGKVR
ncbi:TPA: ISL3 family transposase [Pseudomonas aeruginosa]|nr:MULTISPECIES: ISL3 family transposase [Gammaproteobacteria]HCP3355829.1 ISL3 family transposase [Escherichia coli]EKX9251483.1 ISL3 family transposase [Pseudomonas aeruginosa]MCU8980186.1 ISL3 family transposase [Pseudomonas aeruginosa]MCU8986496.1 ISL3 family transposase [Pseudomonas aeruginosa]MCU8992692.1 ISL3 family transposase [Pseudomonas aeruginosa]